MNLKEGSIMECALCGSEVSRFEAVRVGGLIEQKTGKKFICSNCFKRVNQETINIEFIRKELNVQK